MTTTTYWRKKTLQLEKREEEIIYWRKKRNNYENAGVRTQLVSIVQTGLYCNIVYNVLRIHSVMSRVRILVITAALWRANHLTTSSHLQHKYYAKLLT